MGYSLRFSRENGALKKLFVASRSGTEALHAKMLEIASSQNEVRQRYGLWEAPHIYIILWSKRAPAGNHPIEGLPVSGNLRHTCRKLVKITAFLMTHSHRSQLEKVFSSVVVLAYKLFRHWFSSLGSYGR